MIISSQSGSTDIDDKLYKYIFENSIHLEHPIYLDSLRDGKITLSSLIKLTRTAHIAYTLFFGSYDVVSTLINNETKKIFRDFSGEVSIAIRGKTINLNSIRLIIKDIKNKQSFIAKYVKVQPNPHVKFLSNSTRSLDDQANYIIDSLNLDMKRFRSFSKKSDALLYLIDILEKNNVFVSIEATSSMPQGVKTIYSLTGVYIKDRKFPYLFICNEGLARSDDSPGRKIFTLIYLTICMYKGKSKMVSFKDNVSDTRGGDIYAITEKILMPASLVPDQITYTVKDLDTFSSLFNVSNMALLVRLRHLGYIKDQKLMNSLFSELNIRFENFRMRQKKLYDEKQKEFKINVTQNIIFYQGKAYLRIIKDLYRSGKVRRREINRQLSYSRRSVDIDKVFDKL